MAEALTTYPPATPRASGQGPWTGAPEGGQGGGDGSPSGPVRRLPEQAYRTAIWAMLAPVLMLFASLASSYIVRRGMAGDWRELRLPGSLWVNSFLLLGSSALVEIARRSAPQALRRFRRLWVAGTLLGLAFLAGQAYAWYELTGRGVFLSSNPSHSFFYVLTVLHALHVVSGLLGLAYVWIRATRSETKVIPRLAAEVAAVYWHFLDGLWMALFFLLLYWR